MFNKTLILIETIYLGKNFLFMLGSIGNVVLYVMGILTTQCGVRCLCLSSMHCVYYGLKCCINWENKKNNFTG